MSLKSTVLYADDDIDDLQLIKEVFSNYSNNVQLITFSDGYEALSFLRTLPKQEAAPCLIILDINMPRMDGKEALKDLRKMERYQEVPVILFTTSSHSKDKEFAADHNAGFITKPIDYDQMDVIASTFIEHCTDEVKKKIRKEIS